MTFGISIAQLLGYTFLAGIIGIVLGIISILYHRGYNLREYLIAVINFFTMSIASIYSDVKLAKQHSHKERSLKKFPCFIKALKAAFLGDLNRFPESFLRISNQVINSNGKYTIRNIAMDKIKRKRID
jgi:hypothetical protein